MGSQGKILLKMYHPFYIKILSEETKPLTPQTPDQKTKEEHKTILNQPDLMEIPEEACAPETDIDTDSDSEATAIAIQKSKHVQFSETTSVRTIPPMSFASTAIEVLSDTDSDSFEYPSSGEFGSDFESELAFAV